MNMHPVRATFCAVLRRALVALGLVAVPNFVSAASPSPAEKLASTSRNAEASVAAERAHHLAELGVDGWHAAGTTGRGIKVAVLDGGFRGYKQFLGSALPAHVEAKTFRKDGNFEARDTQHGILCAEVVHTLAPDAELILANWDEDDADSFLKAVKWARDEGARIITCSIIMPRLSDGEGGGPIHAALAKALGDGKRSGDMLCFASAGNTATRHWFGQFHANAAGFHEWKTGVVDNALTPWGDDKVSVELCSKPGSRYELFVFDDSIGAELTHSPLSMTQNPAVRFEPKAGHDYRVRLKLLAGPGGAFHVVSLHSDLTEVNRPGSVAFPGDGPEVVAVGAVDHAGRLTSYSAIGQSNSAVKPDLVAPVPFLSAWRARPFAGTSAAAPQAAALAALVWSRHPDWKSPSVRSALQFSAHDLGIPGPDPETGYGLVHLPAK